MASDVPQLGELVKYTCLLQKETLFSRGPRSGELGTQKLKSHLIRTQSLKVLPLKPGVRQYIAIQATLTARDFSLAYFYPSGPFTCIFSKPLPVFPESAVANTGSCVGAQNKQVTLVIVTDD